MFKLNICVAKIFRIKFLTKWDILSDFTQNTEAMCLDGELNSCS